MVIRWKVVTSDRKSYIISPDSIHSITYIKGSTVGESIKGLGIMTFETKKQAERFGRFDIHNNYKIIRVRGIGRGKRIKWVSYIYKGCMLEFYLKYNVNSDDPGRHAPRGTICYSKVKVID